MRKWYKFSRQEQKLYTEVYAVSFVGWPRWSQGVSQGMRVLASHFVCAAHKFVWHSGKVTCVRVCELITARPTDKTYGIHLVDFLLPESHSRLPEKKHL